MESARADDLQARMIALEEFADRMARTRGWRDG
jgi:hypothetical protein